MFYRIADGNATILHDADGTPVCRIPGASRIYPVDSRTSCAYEHPEGIVLTIADAEALGIRAEEPGCQARRER